MILFRWRRAAIIGRRILISDIKIYLIGFLHQRTVFFRCHRLSGSIWIGRIINVIAQRVNSFFLRFLLGITLV